MSTDVAIALISVNAALAVTAAFIFYEPWIRCMAWLCAAIELAAIIYLATL